MGYFITVLFLKAYMYAVVLVDVVFAYGATGAGKTYTMLGTLESPGITFSAVMALFSQIDDSKNDRVYDVTVSYLEVHFYCAMDIPVFYLEVHLCCIMDVSVSYLEADVYYR